VTALATPKPVQSHPKVREWLRLREGVVEVLSGRVELGQGNGTALLQIVADELDVGMDQLRLVAGDTRTSPDEGFTSGSFSIQVGGMALRLAASAARAVLLAEAARLLQTVPDALAVDRGAVLARGAETGLTWWTLGRDGALDVPVMDHAAPKPPASRRIAGMPVPRTDLRDKMLGRGFVHDVTLPGMLHGRVLHPPSPRQRLAALDAGRLDALPGVSVVRDGSFVGLLAAREETALRALEVAGRAARWTDPPPIGPDLLEAVVAAAGPARTVFSRGTAEADDAKGIRLAARSSRRLIAHAAIGPSCAVAEWRDGRLLVHSHTQGPHNLARALAEAFAVDPAAVDVIHVPGAGCYGHNAADDAAFDAAFLARRAGRPVRVVWSREDELAAAPLGAAAVVDAEAVLGADGRIARFTLAVTSLPFGQRPGRGGAPNLLSAALLAEPCAVAVPGDLPLAADGTGGGADRNAVPLYDIPSVTVTKRIAGDFPVRTSSLRSLGAHLNVFATETLVDDLAAEAGEDPVAFRLAHLPDPRARHVLERVAALSGWPDEGLGIGFARYKNAAAWCAVAVRVNVEEAVRVTEAFAVIDAGEVVNPDGARNQIEGATLQAISWTLKEAVALDGAVVAARDWDAYPILAFSEVPEIVTEIVERPEAPPLGLAEAPVGPTAAAIGNALFRALGVRVRDLPLTREAIVTAMDLGG